eukprot:COSAG06_NODE_189_length_20763_cov_8.677376_11_plen_77_part_00
MIDGRELYALPRGRALSRVTVFFNERYMIYKGQCRTRRRHNTMQTMAAAVRKMVGCEAPRGVGLPQELTKQANCCV